MNRLLKQAFSLDLTEYKSIPFWSWNNSLDEAELTKQIETMYGEGIGGFIMHARTGLKDEYLGEKWFSCIDACLKKAKELGMRAWIYDENGWPSGFVGGKLLENESFRARFLEYSVGEFDSSAYAVFAADTERGYIRTESKIDGVEEYHRVYLCISPANTDILNSDVVDAFIKETHEQYYRRFKDSFGRELVGFFTDEPQYYRWATPYSPAQEPYFEDIREGLIWLFVNDARGYEFRQKYYETLNNLYTDNFYKKLYDWCEAHNCLLTGHSVEESSLCMQMWGGAAVMPSYEFEHIPGIDCLGRGQPFEMMAKQVASVSAQIGRKQILTETYGCAGYDVTPRELASIAEAQYFNGVNLMCQHLYPYSIAGQGKVDHPPVFGPHGNWGKGFKAFNDHFTRLGYLVANTEEIVDIAILHPQHDIWQNYIRSVDYQSVAKQDEDFIELLFELRKHGVTYHLLDERILQRYGENEGDRLKVGRMSYGKILVPNMSTLKETTYKLLKEYKGKLHVIGNPEYLDGKKADISLVSNASFEDFLNFGHIKFSSQDAGALMTHRVGELGDFIFIKNMQSDKNVKVQLGGISKEYRKIDIDTLAEFDVSDEITLDADGSAILIKSEPLGVKKEEIKEYDITENFKVLGMTENCFVLDYANLKKGSEPFGERLPVPAIFDLLLREDYKGEISIRQTFTLNDIMPLTLMMERAVLKSAALNGEEIVFTDSAFDVNFVESDITEFLKVGENEFVYTIDFYQHDGVHFALFDPLATESLRNCLYYDTGVENAFLKGDFTVNSDMSLSKRKGLPPLTNELNKHGYPFFMGNITLGAEIEYEDGANAEIMLDGRFMSADISANGRSVNLVMSDKCDISSILIDGKNFVTIKVYSSLRNMFGPHHYAPCYEPMGVSPIVFTMRTTWESGKSAMYRDEYASVPFGIKNIKICK